LVLGRVRNPGPRSIFKSSGGDDDGDDDDEDEEGADEEDGGAAAAAAAADDDDDDEEEDDDAATDDDNGAMDDEDGADGGRSSNDPPTEFPRDRRDDAASLVMDGIRADLRCEAPRGEGTAPRLVFPPCSPAAGPSTSKSMSQSIIGS
jgi:hypothetical protein